MDSTAEKPTLKTVEITDEMGQSYMDYAMSVIVSRALPDVRDGLKPVHRRILFAMDVGDYHASKSHKKSARIVGDVMGKYHPHGDAAIYETMVRMAQPWAMRNVLVDGQGNFGSLDGDAAAAMRYTEARMSRLSHEITADLEKDTVDWRPTYDESDKEPTVLPARFPNFLVNGGTGIAVGMATNMPTHNLGEAIDACLAYMDNPNITVEELMRVMPGPDFPTKGIIMGRGGIREAYATGRGSIAVSGVADIEELKGNKTRIVVTELPYAVNKVKFMEKIVELVNDKTVEGITDVRDESDREEGVRVVIDLRRDVDPNLTLNKLRKHTQLVTSFGYNATCLDSRGRPRVMGLQQILGEFIAFRRQVIRRRTIHDLDNARDSLHKQVGLYAAISLVDEVVKTIRSASDPDEARVKLMAMDFPTEGAFAELIREADPDAEVGKVFRLSDVQTTSILSLSLRSLTGLERDKIAEKARELSAEIKRYVEILNNFSVLNGILRQEIEEVKAKYASERLTRIEDGEFGDISDEDLIERKDVVLTFTNTGYAKRTDLAAYREQKRGGKGRNGMETKDEDFVTTTLVCTTKTPLIFFTSRGIAHGLKAYRLPEAAPNAKGRPIVNFLTLRQDETLSTILPMPEDPAELEGKSLVFVTDFGTVRRNAASEFADLRKNGKIAIKLEDENGNAMGRLVSVMLANDTDDVIIATRSGICTRFATTDVRLFKGRDSVGVRAINLAEGNTVINASILRHSDATPAERQAYLAGGQTKVVTEAGEQEFALTNDQKTAMAANEQRLLTVSALGYGKRSSSYEYRITNRGGKGIAAANINPTTGPLIACFPVDGEDGLVLVTDGGQTIRTRVSDIREVSRGSRGVRLFKLPEGQQIVSVARVSVDEVEGQETVLEQDEAGANEDTVVQD